MKNDDNYWKHCESGYPKKIRWKVVAGPGNLHPIQMYDLLFDEHDLNIRQIPIPKKKTNGN